MTDHRLWKLSDKEHGSYMWIVQDVWVLQKDDQNHILLKKIGEGVSKTLTCPWVISQSRLFSPFPNRLEGREWAH